MTEITDKTNGLQDEAATPQAKSYGPALRAMSLEEMTALLSPAGFPPYRAKQLFHWVYRQGADSFDEMANLPKDLRAWLSENARLGGGRIIEAQGREDATRKVLHELEDGRFIESVLMRDEGRERTSLCVSSQVGCAVGCTFCLTGYGGFQRHLTPEEIVSQVLAARRELLLEGEQIHSLVFMGMGEPMLNVGPVVRAIGRLTDPEGMAISPRRITVSTSGIVPGLEAFGRAETGTNLAVSLNATTNETRTSIMPLNKRWPIETLMQALAEYPMKPRQRITIEYVLLKGINDTFEDATRLTKLIDPQRCKVNLIMFNPHEYLHYEPVSLDLLDRFATVLRDAHLTVTVRWSKGREIEAACGQLAAHRFGRN